MTMKSFYPSPHLSWAALSSHGRTHSFTHSCRQETPHKLWVISSEHISKRTLSFRCWAVVIDAKTRFCWVAISQLFGGFRAWSVCVKAQINVQPSCHLFPSHLASQTVCFACFFFFLHWPLVGSVWGEGGLWQAAGSWSHVHKRYQTHLLFKFGE